MENMTEGARNLGFVLSEAEAGRSRDIVTVASGEGKLAPGTVLGEITASGKYAVSANAQVVGSEGAETATAVLAYAVDATSADAKAVAIVRAAQVIADELAYDSSVDDAAKKATKAGQLETVGVVVR
ncbi:head decoration protein [Sediminimonas qiaohouensis]|uniref:head decoration protein n=1 Tax=Sediminimonas qiaohouensis TaxID=552061 RepID=UPI0003FB00FE|nr:head decoration protein [Sediminimonas qiaohouensis]